ncbi:type IV secretion system DNA-binding domain-containing protein [Burkholderia cenocepacia]|uniref:type IV secretory system conjugative DNA transfer family protein n=1 Tax=Burkholderia cenocepacia TaxID=95486 RepID=UPI001B9FA3D9|nr:TraM recognition domain-containing protein [Burkholderia cenocepacia]MBR8043126.1 type IV secretion system DNA-binding domain-containing protein [Burkholderia cenocepacia]MBR8324504.1 type IV secretion system DNA-binding domain-containing protein [Burkholderia cenocepacia]
MERRWWQVAQDRLFAGTLKRKKHAPQAHDIEPFKLRTLLEKFYEVRLGGAQDAWSLLSVGVSAVLGSRPLGTMLPTFLPSFAVPACGWLLPALLAFSGSSYLAGRYLEPWQNHFFLKSSIGIPSDDPPAEYGDGLLFGYSTDRGQPIVIPNSELFRHVSITGMSGVGKTVAGSFLMLQQIQRGGGVIFVDGKLDYDNILSMYRFACWAGRGHEFDVINPGDPSLSNSYNPILDGDPDEKASRVLSLVPVNPAADYYRSEAFDALKTIFSALDRAGLVYTFRDLVILLNNGSALEDLVVKLESKGRSEELDTLRLWLNRFRRALNPRDPLSGQIDINKLKQTLGGIAGKLSMFASGGFGQVMNVYSPDVRLYESIKAGRITYVALPTMGKAETANPFAKMFVSDVKTACSWLQMKPEDRPKIPFLCFFDEARSYLEENWGPLFEQARSAGLFLMPAMQTLPTTTQERETNERVTGNATTKLIFRVGSQNTAEECAELIGYTKRVQKSLSSSASKSKSADMLKPTPGHNMGDSAGESYGEREVEEYKVKPDDLKKLAKGECVMLYEGDKVYDLRIPMVNLDKKFIRATASSIKDVRLNFRRLDSSLMKRAYRLNERVDELLAREVASQRQNQNDDLNNAA